MADYIYLLQNRLTSPQWHALEAVREVSRAHGMPVFLAGGAVRDLTSGSPVRDLDFALQGDANALVPDLEAQGAVLAGTHKAFGSVYLTFRGGVRVEIAPTVTVRYPKPGQPEVQSAVILDDLRRRDFTANAMAVSLNEGSYGLLLDPLNGTADIENRELRLVSAYGFIEQPALLLRAARLGERLGWTLEERTQSRYENSKEEGHIGALSPEDRGYELEEIFHEEDPIGVWEHLVAEGWRDTLFPAFDAKHADAAGLEEVRELLGQMESQGLHPDPSAVLFPLVTAKLGESDRAALKALFVRPGFVKQVEGLEARAKELAGQITSKAMTQPSDTWKLLRDADPEVLLWLGLHSRSSAVQSKIKAFLKEWPQMRQRIPYAVMQEMRISPDLPGYDKLLDDLFYALMDGKLETAEAIRSFLEPYSPPAPPQVAVRRRAAKATRGRAKKVQEEESAESSSQDEDLDDDGDSDEPKRVETLPEPTPVLSDEGSADEDGGDAAPLAPPAPKGKPAKKAAPATGKSASVGTAPPASATSSPAKVTKAEPAAKTIPPAPPAKPVKAAPSAPATKGSTSKAATPAKHPEAAAKGSPIKVSASAKHAPAKASAKAAAPVKGGSSKPAGKTAPPAKSAPAKKAPAVVSKVAAKAPAKGSSAAAKSTKAVPAKKAVPVKASAKVVAKAPAKKAAPPARKAPPAKAVAKKTAAKSKGRR